MKSTPQAIDRGESGALSLPHIVPLESAQSGFAGQEPHAVQLSTEPPAGDPADAAVIHEMPQPAESDVHLRKAA